MGNAVSTVEGNTKVGEASVHWRRDGSGPAIVFVHGFPLWGQTRRDLSRAEGAGDDRSSQMLASSKYTGQSPRHSSAFFCRASDVYWSRTSLSAPAQSCRSFLPDMRGRFSNRDSTKRRTSSRHSGGSSFTSSSSDLDCSLIATLLSAVSQCFRDSFRLDHSPVVVKPWHWLSYSSFQLGFGQPSPFPRPAQFPTESFQVREDT
jgi:hypothetical protein